MVTLIKFCITLTKKNIKWTQSAETEWEMVRKKQENHTHFKLVYTYIYTGNEINDFFKYILVLFRKYKLSFIGLYEYMSVSRILFYMFSDDAILEASHSMDSRLLFTSTGLYSPVSVLSQLPRLLSAE